MKKATSFFSLMSGLLLLAMASCKTNPTDKVQGVFSVDKESLKEMMEDKIGSENIFASALLNKAIQNAVIEFKIKGDSIKGLMFLLGETTIVSSKIQVVNDSMILNSENIRAYLIPNEKGLLFKNQTSGVAIQLLKSELTELSTETNNVLSKLAKNEKELKEFTDNLGKWRKGKFVDEFGDDTGKDHAYLVVQGEQENSSVVKSDVFVKSTMDNGSLYFQIFNSSMTLKENFPNSEFGTVKIKFPNGDVKSEKVFFYKNTVSESPDDKNPLIYNYITSESGELKILLDLSTANSYYTDKYQFSISKGNLDEILSELKQ